MEEKRDILPQSAQSAQSFLWGIAKPQRKRPAGRNASGGELNG